VADTDRPELVPRGVPVPIGSVADTPLGRVAALELANGAVEAGCSEADRADPVPVSNGVVVYNAEAETSEAVPEVLDGAVLVGMMTAVEFTKGPLGLVAEVVPVPSGKLKLDVPL
jgi:hypothetical protein